MKIMVAVDRKGQSELLLTALSQMKFLPSDSICICMVINPFIGSPDFERRDYLRWLLRTEAWARLEGLAQFARNLNLTVEMEVCETRFAEISILLRAIRWKADCLMVSIRSLSNVKQRLLERIFSLLISKSVWSWY